MVDSQCCTWRTPSAAATRTSSRRDSCRGMAALARTRAPATRHEYITLFSAGSTLFRQSESFQVTKVKVTKVKAFN